MIAIRALRALKLQSFLNISAWTRSALLILLAFAPNPIQGESVCSSQPGYFIWSPSAERPLDNVFEQGNFRVAIERQYENEAQKKLLTLVEATYPIYPDSILIPGFNRPEEGSPPRWWTSEVDGIRIPVAVTRAAVDYYLDLIKSLRAADTTDTTESGNLRQRSAELQYTASIQPAAMALENVEDHPGDLAGKYIVRLEMSWESDCGLRCGLQFTRTRMAVVSGDGQVLEVLEDPLAPIMID